MQLTPLSTHWAPRKKIKKGTIFFGHGVYKGGSLKKLLKPTDINQDKIVPKQPGTPFLTTKGIKKFRNRWQQNKLTSKLIIYKSNWLHVTRMNNRMPKIVLNYKPNRRRRLGRPLNRLLDEAETRLSRPNSWRIMMMIPSRRNEQWCRFYRHKTALCMR